MFRLLASGLLASALLPACSSSGDTSSNDSTAVGTGDDDAQGAAGSDDDTQGNATPIDVSEPDPGAGSDDDSTEPGVPDITVALPAIPIGGGGDADAGVEPGPAATPEPEPAASSEPAVPPEPIADAAVPPEPIADAAVPPEPVVEPVVEPQPVIEPVPPEPAPIVEPAPDPCATLPLCDMSCPAGSINPTDANGCVDTCSCEALPDVCQTCTADEECVEVTTERDTHYACAAKVKGCVNILPCGCFQDYGNCTMNLSGVCQCDVPTDPCGGCADGKRCIYQDSGQTGPRYLCAAASDCGGPDDCACIQQQGDCVSDPDRGVCSCSWGGYTQ
jgi:hypothetical protein